MAILRLTTAAEQLVGNIYTEGCPYLECVIPSPEPCESPCFEGEGGEITIRNDCEESPDVVEVENARILEFVCAHFRLTEIIEGEEVVGVNVDLFEGEADAIIRHDGDKWVKLPPPENDAVLVYDTDEEEGSRVMWKEIDEFVCPEPSPAP